MVAFLKKPEGSEGFHQIVNFLNSTHIKYALTKNPTIYISLIHQFWQTASASTSENGEMEITATIDGRVKTVTEASIRRHLKLEDSDVINTLPNTKNFEQLALMGAPSTSQPPTSPPSMQTTHVTEEATTMSYDSPFLRVYSLGSDEGSMTLHKLTVLCTILSKKVESLESDLKQTKLTYGAAYSKLIMKVKKLENRIKSSKARRRVILVVLEDEDDLEDPFKQGRKISQLDKDEGITLVQMGTQSQGRHKHDLDPDFEFTAPKEVYTAEPERKQTDEELAQKLQAEEKGKFFEAEKERLLVEMINERKRLFAQQRAEQRRNKPMTQAQQRTYMCNYIKNIGSHTLQQLKKLSFDEIKVLFETTMKRVKDFVPMESDRLVPKILTGSSKRTAETELEHEGSKRKKTNEEQSAEE
ncbi:hypothetical protein Tco_1409236 [Tanacetum coccineum]